MLQDADRRSGELTVTSTLAGIERGVRRNALDVVLGGLGVALGWLSLWFPFGRDQGLYHYVAREWLHGYVPYRDVLDHKTPGIYMVHALAIALFGENMWGIRVLELFAVILTGLVAATFTVERGDRPLPGVRGVSILAAGGAFYGFVNFWDSSQSEIWYSLLGVSSVWAARRIEHTARAEVATGFLAGLALVMKPTAIWFVLTAMALMLGRTRAGGALSVRALGLATARFALGFAIAVGPLLAYFGLTGALPDLYDVVVRSNARYAQLERGASSIDEVTRRLHDFFFIFNFVAPLLAFAGTLGLGVGIGRGGRFFCDRHLLAIVLCLGGIAAFVMQMKFYVLHYTAVLAPATVLSANVALDTRLLLARWRVGRTLAPALLAAILLVCWTGTNGYARWREESQLVAGYLRGELTRSEFAQHFQFPGIGFWYAHSEEAGSWLREHAKPTDTVAVRGFEPQLYAISGLRYSGRHFWTVFLTSPTRGDEHDLATWNDEDRTELDTWPPRFAVALTHAHGGPDSPAWFLERGYQVRHVVHEFTILERGEASAKH